MEWRYNYDLLLDCQCGQKPAGQLFTTWQLSVFTANGFCGSAGAANPGLSPTICRPGEKVVKTGQRCTTGRVCWQSRPGLHSRAKTAAGRRGGPHTLAICGNKAEAKQLNQMQTTKQQQISAELLGYFAFKIFPSEIANPPIKLFYCQSECFGIAV